MRIGLGDNMRVVDTYLGHDKCQRSKGERHTMVFVGVDGGIWLGGASLAIPYQLTAIYITQNIT